MNEPINPGIAQGMAANDYHATAAVSNSMLSDLKRSPAHMYALHLAPDRPVRVATPAMAAGTLTHALVLEPASIDERYIVKPDGLDGRTKEGKEWMRSVPPYMTITSAEQMAVARSQREAVMRVPMLRTLLNEGQAEVSAFARDESTGLMLRARPDWINGVRLATVVDLKTINDLSPEKVSRSIAEYGYHRQAAHYTNVLKGCGIDVQEFVFAFVSSNYPFVAGAFVLDEEAAQQGQDEVSELLDLYSFCEKHGQWPGFEESVQLVGLPNWAKRSSEIEVSFVD